ncbi:MAG: DUF3047 domain-containing protein [Candidatus Rokuibacteriota bacterium]
MRHRVLVTVLLLGVLSSAWAATEVGVEDWKQDPLGSRGVPEGWKAQTWGKADYNGFTISDDGGRSLHLVSRSTSSMIVKEIAGKVNLTRTPVLQWSWRVVGLPKGADARHAATDDEAGQIYVIWRRFPEMLRSRIIGYVWDTTAPPGEFVKSQKTRTVTYVVVRSGSAELGTWLTEQRNVFEDYRKIYGEAPDSPDAVAVGIDSDDTKSSAEASVGPILFRAP